MFKIISTVSWFIISIVFLIYTTLAFFVVAGIDDLYYLKLAENAGFLAANHFLFDTMGGRYTSNAVMTVCGLIGHDPFNIIRCDRFIPVGVIFLFPVSLYSFIRAITANLIPKMEAVGYSILFCVVYFTATPSIQDVIYWPASAATHTLACILTLFLMACLLKQLWLPAWRWNILSACLVFLLVGTSESIAVAVNAILLTGNILIYLYTKKINIVWMLSFLFCTALILLIWHAGGNDARVYFTDESIGFLKSIGYVKRGIICFFPKWTTHALLILTSIYLFLRVPSTVFNQFPFFQKINWTCLIIFTLFWFMLLIISPFLSAFLISKFSARYWNFPFLIFMLGWYLNICLIKIILLKSHPNLVSFSYNNYFMLVLIGLIGLAAFFNFQFLFAANDLINKVSPYNNILYNRIRYMQSTSSQRIGFSPIPPEMLPLTIHRYDIMNNPDCYFNYQYAFFFEKEQVFIRPASTENCVISAERLKYFKPEKLGKG